MKRLKYIISFVILALLTGSCGNDFLNLTPESSANEEDFYRTKEEVETAMVAVYSSLHDIYGSLGPMYYFGALGSDDAYTDDLGTGSYQQFETMQLKVNNTDVLSAWNMFYEAIARINKIIARSEPLSFDEKESYLAEMKFIRALYYFNMSQIWGGVPLVVRNISISESYGIGRATMEDMYTQIISDLTDGTQHLKTVGNERHKGVPTQGAAYALLGKVYLTKGDKNSAATALLNIYKKEYKLVDAYADLWDLTKKNGKESIFEIQYMGGSSNAPSTYWALYSPANNLGAITLQGGGHNQVTDDLWNDYEFGDPRKDVSIQDGWMNKSNVFVATRFPLKWVDHTKDYNGKREASNNNFIVLRYADVLLMLSEATGDPKYLNEVRTRVGLPSYGDASYPSGKYNTFDLAVEHERRIELAMEFHRLFDIKRTGRALDLLKSSKKNNNGALNGLTVDNLSWPIPETVIDQNPGFWKPQQNPGY